jgi:hypothetical protein
MGTACLRGERCRFVSGWELRCVWPVEAPEQRERRIADPVPRSHGPTRQHPVEKRDPLPAKPIEAIHEFVRRSQINQTRRVGVAAPDRLSYNIMVAIEAGGIPFLGLLVMC